MAPMVFSRSAIRELDRRAIEDYAMLGVVLMENAGRGVAQVARTMALDEKPIVIVCGTGNNGGDGFVAARHLANADLDPQILIAGDPKRIRGDARTNLEVTTKMGLPTEFLEGEAGIDFAARRLENASLIIDAILGTGLDRPIHGFVAGLIARINAVQESGTPVLGVDLPSGLDADTGEPLGTCIRASATATFVGHKRGFQNPQSRGHTGRVEVVDIGVPAALARQLAD